MYIQQGKVSDFITAIFLYKDMLKCSTFDSIHKYC